MTAKIELPEFDHDKFDSDTGCNTSSNLLVAEIGVATKMVFAMPKGAKLEAFNRYIEQFDSEKILMFLDKLKTSVYVKNPKFSLDFMVRHDIVNELLAGSREAVKASKYYDIKTLYV